MIGGNEYILASTPIAQSQLPSQTKITFSPTSSEVKVKFKYGTSAWTWHGHSICITKPVMVSETYYVDVCDGGEDKYRFGHQTQEKVNEIAGIGNHYTAEFWEYDSRVARRWNVDPVIKEYESSYLAFGGNPILNVDIKGDDTVVYNQKGKEIDRVKVPDIEYEYSDDMTGRTTYYKQKVPDVYFVEFDDGDTKVNGRNTFRALSKESIFGDADDPLEYRSNIFDKLDRNMLRTTQESQSLLDCYLYNNPPKGILDFYSNANSKKKYDFKRSILAGDRESDANRNTSYLVVWNDKKVIMNRNEAGNYLTGMAAKKLGVWKWLNSLSGDAVEWINFKGIADEPNEKAALKKGYEDYKK